MTHYEKCHIDGDTTIHDELVYIGQTTCGRIEIPLKCQNILNIDINDTCVGSSGYENIL